MAISATPTMFLDFDELDIRNDLSNILSSMESLRRLAIIDGKISDEQKDEYGSRAWEVASCFDELYKSSLKGVGEIQSSLDIIISHLEQKPWLLLYDYRHNEFWEKMDKDFVDALDRIAVLTLGDDYSYSGMVHHLFGGVRLTLLNAPSDEMKQRVFKTILPISDYLNEYDRPFILKKFRELGIRHIRAIEDNTLILDDSLMIENEIRLANGLDLETRVVVDSKWKKEYEESYKVKIEKEKYELPIIPSTGAKYYAGRLLGALIKFPIVGLLTSPVIGSLPESLQIRTERYLKSCGIDLGTRDPKYWTITNVGAELVTAMILSNYGHPVDFSFSYFANFIMKLNIFGFLQYYRINEHYKERAIGSILVKPVFWPIELILDRISEKIYTNPSLVEFPNSKKKKVESKADGSTYTLKHNFWQFVEDAAKTVAKEEFEKNLTVAVGAKSNIHNFGKKFDTWFRKEIQHSKTGFNGEAYIDIKNSAYSFYQVHDAGDYDKLTGIICFEDIRYPICFLTQKGNLRKLEDVLGKIDEILHNYNVEVENETEKDVAKGKFFERVTNIGKLVKARYIHLARYDNNALSFDRKSYSAPSR